MDIEREKREIGDDRFGLLLGRGLGLFSIGLGVAEMAAPFRVARLIGVDHCGNTMPTLQAFGAREVITGIGLLMKPNNATGVWARVFGDLIDLAFLSWALKTKSLERNRTIGALVAVAGVAALDVFAGMRRRRILGEPVRRSITINSSPEQIYAVFRNFERLPEFMTWVESVRDLGGGLSRWRVRTPVGGTIEYNAELIEDVPNQRISWRSVQGSTVPNRGSVTFIPAPGDRGTEVIVELQVAAPLGKTIAGAEAQGDLHRLKQVLETGEVMRSDASIHRGPHAARPEGGMR